MTVALDPALVTELAAQVSGPLLGPGDAGYDPARAVHNGLIDRPSRASLRRPRMRGLCGYPRGRAGHDCRAASAA